MNSSIGQWRETNNELMGWITSFVAAILSTSPIYVESNYLQLDFPLGNSICLFNREFE